VNRPAWFVGILLGMLAALMGAHLWMLHTSLKECDDYAAILLDQARRVAKQQKEQVKIEASNAECNNIEKDYADAAEQYMGTILALLGGAGVAGGIAMKRPPNDT
jgi:sensor c-di-GMP phosphodiesterase-like protein